MSNAEPTKITKEMWDELADLAFKAKGLRQRESEHGMEYGCFVNRCLVAQATPNEDGEYVFLMHL